MSCEGQEAGWGTGFDGKGGYYPPTYHATRPPEQHFLDWRLDQSVAYIRNVVAQRKTRPARSLYGVVSGFSQHLVTMS